MRQAKPRTPEQELEHLRSINASYASKIARLEFRLSMTEGELARVETELVAQRRLRRQVKELYHSLDGLILNTIDRRGYTRKQKPAKFSDVTLPDSAVNDTQQLERALREYDTKSYFRLHSPKTAMKLRYRVASKAYRVTRDKSIKLAVGSYRLTKRLRRG